MLPFIVLISFLALFFDLAAGASLPGTDSRFSTEAQVSAYLHAHNIVRAAHNAAALRWSADLAAKAESWVDRCMFEHTGGSLSDTRYGEHHVAATGFFPIATAVGLFSQDKDQYNPARPTYNHFTQVVWKSTTEVGCAQASCDGILGRRSGRATYYLCLYNPAGNIIGEAPANVQL